MKNWSFSKNISFKISINMKTGINSIFVSKGSHKPIQSLYLLIKIWRNYDSLKEASFITLWVKISIIIYLFINKEMRIHLNKMNK